MEAFDALLRAACLLASCGAAGLALHRPGSTGLRRWLAVAAATNLLQLGWQPVRYTGRLDALLELQWFELAILSPHGAGLALRLAALGLLAVAVHGNRTNDRDASERGTAAPAHRRKAAVLALATLALGFSLDGHVRGEVGGPAALWPGLLTLHLALLAAWGGGLLHLLRLPREPGPGGFDAGLWRFSRFAVIALPLALACGVALAWGLLGGWPGRISAYVTYLLAKVLLVCAVLALAGAIRLRRFEEPRIAVRLEAALAVMIVLITVTMTTFTAPR